MGISESVVFLCVAGCGVWYFFLVENTRMGDAAGGA